MNRPAQYRLLAALKRQPWRRKLIPLLLLAMTGCSTADLDCADLRQGACKVHFTRFATDTSASFSGPEGLGFTYSSSPNAAAISELAAAVRALSDLVPRQPLPAMLEAREL
jgi:hypothetical protein